MSSRDGMFADIDRMDATAWSGHLAEDATMRFGNADPVHGREACRDALAGFYDLIGGLRHERRQQWEVDEATIVESDVTYTRKDGVEVTVPVVTIYRTNGDDEIADYRVFADLAPVFA